MGGDFNTELTVNPQLFNKELDAGLTLQTRKTCCSATYGVRDKTYPYLYDYIAIDERLRFDVLIVPIDSDKNVRFSDHRPVYAEVSSRMIIFDNLDTGLRERVVKEGARLYRGVDQVCQNLAQAVRPDRPEWFAQLKTTSLTYSKGKGCLFRLETAKRLLLIDIWNPVSMKTIISAYRKAFQEKRITQNQLDAFSVFSGYGIDKLSTPTNPTPVLKFLSDRGIRIAPPDPLWRQSANVSQDAFPFLKRISQQSVEMNGIVWGPAVNEFDRTSLYELDMDVMRTLQTLFPMYQGVYAAPVPSTYHRGIFTEEFILFPDPVTNTVMTNVRELNRTAGKRTRRLRRLANVVTTHRTPHAHRKPLRKAS
jgi:hypothetical protein